MKLKYLLAGFLIVDASKTPSKKVSTDRKLAISIRERSWDLIDSLVKYDENIAISPLSIIGAMYMLAAGSAGNSRKEILETIFFQNEIDENDVQAISKPFEAYFDLIDQLQTQADRGYTLDIANGLFHQKVMSSYSSNDLKALYVDLLKKNFIQDSSNIRPVDFMNDPEGTTDAINQWVSKQTKGKIPKLFENPLSSDTLVILASSLYYKASWTEKFRLIKQGSKEEERLNLCWAPSWEILQTGVCQEGIQWMRKEEDLHIHQIEGVNKTTVVELPMKSKAVENQEPQHTFTMQLWLPEKFISNEAEDRAFREFIKEKQGKIRRFMGGKQKAEIIMPKFEIETKQELADALQEMGIKEVFGSNANLEPMLGEGHNAKVSKVNHAVKLNIDEKGIEGAAVTAVQIHSRTFSQPKLIQVNKPFYFIITNRCYNKGGSGKSCPTGNVPLFIGRLVDPTL